MGVPVTDLSCVPRWARPMIAAHDEYERQRMAEETTIIRLTVDLGGVVTPGAAKALVGQEPEIDDETRPAGQEPQRGKIIAAKPLPDGRVELTLEVPQYLVDDLGVRRVSDAFSLGFSPGG